MYNYYLVISYVVMMKHSDDGSTFLVRDDVIDFGNLIRMTYGDLKRTNTIILFKKKILKRCDTLIGR